MSNFGPAKTQAPLAATEVRLLRAEVRRLRARLAAREEELLMQLRRYEPDAT